MEDINNEDNKFEIDEEKNNFEINKDKYKFDYTTKFKTCDLNEKEKKKFILNLFLMSSKLDIMNKVICLEKLYDISKVEKDFKMIYYMTNKILKYIKQKGFKIQYININNLFSYEFLNNNSENYYYAFKTIKDIERVTDYSMKNYVLYQDIKCFIDLKILESKELFTNILEPDHINYIYDIIIKIIKENENIEIVRKDNDIIIKNINELDIRKNNKEKKDNDIQSENQTNKEKTKNIDISQMNDDIIDDDKKEEPNDEKEKKEKDNKKKIITDNNLRIKEELQKMISYSKIQPNKKNINSKNQFLYAINRIWLENAKSFIDTYRFLIGSELLKDFLNESFDPEYVLLWYLSDEKIQVNPQKQNFFPFPGPINNIPITSYKDQWIDMRNKDENDLIQKNVRNGKDYYLIEYDDWRLLKNIFQFTNELKRKKDNIDMINFEVIILDQRFKKFKNFNINLLKKKSIQIGKKKKYLILKIK